jgi:hypothetical protein
MRMPRQSGKILTEQLEPNFDNRQAPCLLLAPSPAVGADALQLFAVGRSTDHFAQHVPSELK